MVCIIANERNNKKFFFGCLFTFKIYHSINITQVDKY